MIARRLAPDGAGLTGLMMVSCSTLCPVPGQDTVRIVPSLAIAAAAIGCNVPLRL
jgi:hypothetical protein